MKFKDKAWIFISFLTLVTAVVWFGISLKATFNKSTVSESVESIISPLDPSLDENVLQSLKRRSEEGNLKREF